MRFLLTSFFLFFITIDIFAGTEAVVYHCPSLNEISNSFGAQTVINNKEVTWSRNSLNLMNYEHAIEFKKVILEPTQSDSFDMNVSCIYRTNKNRKIIASPQPSFHWYVDGVAEKALGRSWTKIGDRLECSESIKNCLFALR